MAGLNGSSTRLNTMSNPFLTEVYQKLDLQNGCLLSACALPEDKETKEEWLNKGDWLELAKKIGAEKLFFIRDEPLIVFYQFNQQPTDDDLKDVLRNVWCMSRPQMLFVTLPNELQTSAQLHVYDLTKPPLGTNRELLEPIKKVEHITQILEVLHEYNRELLESGYLPHLEKHFGKRNKKEDSQRADKQLINDLKAVRKELTDRNLNLKYAHALISRVIFVRYLEDRGILLKNYFEQVAGNNQNWQKLLLEDLEKPYFNPKDKKYYFYKALKDKDFTYALFDKLAYDFNGDLFPQEQDEQAHVEQKHLDLLRDFLLGNVGKQENIFFWLYDFEIVPIELISNIYEEFYSTTQSDDKKGTGSHYTPSVLVEFVLSEVLKSDKLNDNPIVLDPACGSGIFLVEAFRRIVRFNILKKKRELNASELREILARQIRGIEINKNAIEITAFSLYLALLHYQNPPDILAQIKMVEPSDKPLPHLIYSESNKDKLDYYNILFSRNAFNIAEGEIDKHSEDILPLSDVILLPIELNSIDIIVGNPPWGFVTKKASEEIKKAQNQAIEWCDLFGWTIGDKELSQAFIARSLSLLKENGEAGLLVSTGVFLKRHENSQKFRSKWLNQATVKKVVNFAHVRHAFFSAVSPFAFVYYQNKPASYSHRVQHWSAKKLETIENNQAVVLYNSDIRQIKQHDLINNEVLWKIYWWGGHRDASLINILKLEKSLSNFIDKNSNRKPIIGQGFTTASGKKEADWMSNYEELPVKFFNRYEDVKESNFIKTPKKFYIFGNRELYDGWRLLIKRGITEKKGADGRIDARLENKKYCFRHSIHGVKIDNLGDWQRKVIVAISWSSLTRYYLFMTSGSWGMWHHETQLSEIINLPIRLPTDDNLKEKIVSIVDRLRNRETELGDDAKIKDLENQLDKAIFELYELSESEQDLVLDMCETGLEFFYQANKSNAVKAVENYPKKQQGFIRDLPQNRDTEKGLQGYLYAFLDFWNDELEPEGEFNWRIINPPNNPMLAVIFTTQNKGEPLPELQNDLTEWKSVLERCGNALKKEISRDIYIQGMVRSVSDTEIIIIKRNERRLWTRTAAREDAEATLAQAIRLQESL